jgi:hypothetical protein
MTRYRPPDPGGSQPHYLSVARRGPIGPLLIFLEGAMTKKIRQAQTHWIVHQQQLVKSPCKQTAPDARHLVVAVS